MLMGDFIVLIIVKMFINSRAFHFWLWRCHVLTNF